MAENYWGKDAIEVRFADCGHSMFIPLGHSANHERCYACDPELAKEPIPHAARTATLHGDAGASTPAK